MDLKHGNPALAAGERGGAIEYLDAPEGVIAFSRAVDGNKVIVAVNFGVTPALSGDSSAVPSEAKESTDNRPAASTAGTLFLNLACEPVTVNIPLDAEYIDWFSGAKVTGSFSATLAPGEYVVLTR